jgi:hypothetical protein
MFSSSTRRLAALCVVVFAPVALDTSARGDAVTLSTGITIHGNLIAAPSGTGAKAIAMITSKSSTASPNKTGAKIVGDIFRKYRKEP